MGRRSSGGINFGEALLSQFKVASTSGLCLRKLLLCRFHLLAF
jgi:hypothetical protein